MSVRLMSLVFEAELTDLPYRKDGEDRNAKASTAKLLLLAYADHANDEGEGAYPGYTRLELKTALSRQGIADTLEALKQNDFMELEGVSKLNTNSYTINKERLQALVKPLDSHESSHLTTTSQATGLKPSFNPPLTKTTTRAATVPNIYTLYEQNIGALTPMIADVLDDAQKTYPAEWLADVIALAVTNNKRNWKYCEAILKRWKVEGKDSGEKPQRSNGKNAPAPVKDDFMEQLEAKRKKLKAEVA